MPPPDISAPLFAPALLILLLLPLLIIIPGNAALDRHTDCQANEQFLQCGTCEGSCKEPIVVKCRKECKPPRCECQAKRGFVRAHDGACIPVSECHSYKGTYGSGQGGPKASMAANRLSRPAGGGVGGGGAGFGLQSTDGTNGNELAPPPTPFPSLLPTTKVPSPPSIAPPSFHGRTQMPPQSPASFSDQVPTSADSSPPVIFKHRDGGNGGGGGGGGKQSQMNLFADVAESQSDGGNGLTGGGEAIDGEEAAVEEDGRDGGGRGGGVPNPLARPSAAASSPPSPIRPPPQHQPSPIGHQPNVAPPSPPSSSQPLVRPIPRPPPPAPQYSILQQQQHRPSAAPLPTRPAPPTPKFDAFGVGHSLTIQNAAQDQGVLSDDPQQQGGIGTDSQFGTGDGTGTGGGGQFGGGGGTGIGGSLSKGQQLRGNQAAASAEIGGGGGGQIGGGSGELGAQQQQDEPAFSGGKCGGARGCKTGTGRGGGGPAALASDELPATNWRSSKRLRTKSQPYLYAYVNPPVDELERASGVANVNAGGAGNGIGNQQMIMRRQSPPNGAATDWKDEEEADGNGMVLLQERQANGQPAEERMEPMAAARQREEGEEEPSRDQPLAIAPLPANLRIYRQRRLLFRQRRRSVVRI